MRFWWDYFLVVLLFLNIIFLYIVGRGWEGNQYGVPEKTSWHSRGEPDQCLWGLNPGPSTLMASPLSQKHRWQVHWVRQLVNNWIWTLALQHRWQVHLVRQLINNWILMSCQPHRVTSGQSNSGHKQMHISKLFSYIYIFYKPFVKSVHKTNHFANIKQSIQAQTSDPNFRRVSPVSITPFKRAFGKD